VVAGYQRGHAAEVQGHLDQSLSQRYSSLLRHSLFCSVSNPPARHFSCLSLLQEASGYFFCLEDRALLCRDCDVAIHTVNSFVSVHQRFLLTGVQVGLDPADPVPPIAEKHVNAVGGSVNQPVRHQPRRSPTVQFSVEGSASVPTKNVTNGDCSRQNFVPTARAEVVDWTMNNSTIRSVESPPKYISEESPTLLQSSQTTTVFSNQINGNSDGAYHLSFSGGNVTDSLPDWPVDEFFSNSEYGPNFGFSENGSSKASYYIYIFFLYLFASLSSISLIAY
jgi:hypothetical protein